MTKVKIKQFKNLKKEPVAGLTPEEAVYDSTTGVRLKDKLGNVNLQEFRDLQQQCVNNINAKVVEAEAEIEDKYNEVKDRTQATLISSNATGLEGSNVEEKLTDAGSKLTELGKGVGGMTVASNEIVTTNTTIKSTIELPLQKGEKYQCILSGTVTDTLVIRTYDSNGSINHTYYDSAEVGNVYTLDIETDSVKLEVIRYNATGGTGKTLKVDLVIASVIMPLIEDVEILKEGVNELDENVGNIEGRVTEVESWRSDINNPDYVRAIIGKDKSLVLGITNEGNIDIPNKLFVGGKYLDTRDSLPLYYLEYLNNAVDKINLQFLNGGQKADSFLFFTDSHYDRNKDCQTAAICNFILSGSVIDKCVFGGDVNSVNTETDVLYDEVKESLDIANSIKKSGRYFALKGNHDFYCRYGSDNITTRYPDATPCNVVFATTDKSVIKDESNNIGCYYYYDEPASKIRYIFIDSQYYSRDANIGGLQTLWIINTLKNVPNGYDVIMFGHMGIQKGTIASATELSNFGDLRNIIEAYQNKSVVSYDGNTYDLTNSKGSLVAYINGHMHQDAQNYVNGTAYISVAADVRTEDASNSYLHDIVPYPSRIKGTVEEQCVDAFVVDRINNKIYANRIGNGFNRIFNLSKVSLNVGGAERLISSFPEVKSWECHDADSGVYTSKWTFTNNCATVSKYGTVTANSSGEVIVAAVAENGDKEFFYVKIN